MSGACYRVTTKARLGTGILLLLLGLGLIVIGWPLEWGVAVTTVLPGVLLLVPACGLLAPQRLRLEGDLLRINDGPGIPLEGSEIEIVPTAGLWAVILHPVEGRERPLATWIRRGRAEALVEWLEEHSGRRFPRRRFEAHELDR